MSEIKVESWVNDEDCVWDGQDYSFVGDAPHYRESCVIQSAQGFTRTVFYTEISKPISKEQLARREALKNGRAYYNLVVSVCMGWDGREHLDWNDLSDSDKGIHIELAEKIGFKESR